MSRQEGGCGSSYDTDLLVQGRDNDLGSRMSKPLPWEGTATESQKERKILAPSPSWHLSRLFPGPHPISGCGSREGFRQGSDLLHTGAFQGWNFTMQNDAKPVKAGGRWCNGRGGGKKRFQHSMDKVTDI